MENIKQPQQIDAAQSIEDFLEDKIIELMIKEEAIKGKLQELQFELAAIQSQIKHYQQLYEAKIPLPSQASKSKASPDHTENTTISSTSQKVLSGPTCPGRIQARQAPQGHRSHLRPPQEQKTRQSQDGRPDFQAEEGKEELFDIENDQLVREYLSSEFSLTMIPVILEKLHRNHHCNGNQLELSCHKVFHDNWAKYQQQIDVDLSKKGIITVNQDAFKAIPNCRIECSVCKKVCRALNLGICEGGHLVCCACFLKWPFCCRICKGFFCLGFGKNSRGFWAAFTPQSYWLTETKKKVKYFLGHDKEYDIALRIKQEQLQMQRVAIPELYGKATRKGTITLAADDEEKE